jgi:hypothetical protein
MVRTSSKILKPSIQASSTIIHHPLHSSMRMAKVMNGRLACRDAVRTVRQFARRRGCLSFAKLRWAGLVEHRADFKVGGVLLASSNRLPFDFRLASSRRELLRFPQGKQGAAAIGPAL